jgi:hypothetical protein
MTTTNFPASICGWRCSTFFELFPPLEHLLLIFGWIDCLTLLVRESGLLE